jgi:hypothetical protein
VEGEAINQETRNAGMTDSGSGVAEKRNGLELALRFHELYEQRAPDFGYETRKETRRFDPESQNGKLMISVCSTIAEEVKEKWTAFSEADAVLRIGKSNYHFPLSCYSDVREIVARHNASVLSAPTDEEVTDVETIRDAVAGLYEMAGVLDISNKRRAIQLRAHAFAIESSLASPSPSPQPPI